MRAKQVKGITIEKIAEWTGQPQGSVRRHLANGVFDFGNPLDVMEYVVGYRLGVMGRRRKNER